MRHSFHPSGSRRGFTLAELIVSIAILAILSTIAIIAYPEYQNSAKDSAIRANIRSLYTAISSEGAASGRGARYYVKYDQNLALSGGVVVFDTYPLSLNGWEWDNRNSNYSAGYPDFVKLKLPAEKFRISENPSRYGLDRVFAETTWDVLVGAVSVQIPDLREKSFVQVAGVLTSGYAAVIGDYPVWITPDSLGGLIKDSATWSQTGALIDGLLTWVPPSCAAEVLQGYSVPALESGQQASVSKNIDNGAVLATAKCAFGKLAILSENPSCATGYVPGTGLSCVADVCWQGVPANAVSTATSQSVGTDWHYSTSAGQCTFSCSSGYSWDGAACRQGCSIPAVQIRNGLTYAVSSVGALSHGDTASKEAVHTFWVSPANGSLTIGIVFSCSNGVITPSIADGAASCGTNYTWNADRSAPQCSANTRTVDCQSAVPSNATKTTPTTYVQTWNWTSWGDDLSWTQGATTCGFSCNANYVLSGGACVASTRTAACAGLPSNAVWNSASSVSQAWNGSAWAPSLTWSYDTTPSSSECRFKCQSNFTWNGSACVADTKTFTCSSKPANGTVWNSVSQYSQTWNGSAWAPSDSVTSYDTAASTSACRYKCDAWYGWDEAASSCKAALGGSCWSAASVSTYAYPTASWCATWTKSDVDTSWSDGGFDWTCSGQYGWTAATCSAPKKGDAACWSANWASFPSTPSSNLCTTWTASSVTGSGPWNWTCSGVNGGNSASCSAVVTTYSVSGTFGANGASATVVGCWKSVTADANWAFSFASVKHGTACNNIAATKTNYTCVTSANGPASLSATTAWLGGSCNPNTQSATCGGSIPAYAAASTATTYSQTWNGSAWAPAYNWTYNAGTCWYVCSSGYHTENGWASCVANTRACSIANGAGSQTWNGSAWGGCTVVSCDAGYVAQ